MFLVRVMTAVTCIFGMGCVDSLKQPPLLENARILAVRADPPQIRLGETATLEVLFHSDEEPTGYSWSWCPTPGGQDVDFECTVTEEEFLQQVNEAGELELQTVNFSLGSDASSSFPFTEELGISFVTIELTIDFPSGPLRTRKSLTLLDDSAVPNQNPVATEILAGTAGGSGESISAGTAVQLASGQIYKLAASIPAEAAESFLPPGPEGEEPEAQTERMTVSWFTTSGTISVAATTSTLAEIDGISTLVPASEVAWELPKVDVPSAANTKTVYAIIRDGRGGVTWLQGVVIPI